MRPQSNQDERGPTILAGWCNQTANYWPGLFHRYADPRIPGTNNTMERGIKETKQIIRVLARNPRPAVRFIRHGATIAMVTTRAELPGESFLASRSAEEWQSAEAALRAKRRRSGAALRARRNPEGFAHSVLERWKKACADAR